MDFDLVYEGQKIAKIYFCLVPLGSYITTIVVDVLVKLPLTNLKIKTSIYN